MQEPNNWESFKTIVLAVLIAMVFRSFAYEPFHIPSESMKETLLVGDYLFVSKFSYGYSRYSFPFGLGVFDGRVMKVGSPQRGDVVVFRPPAQPRTDFIKRVIGLPGDKVQVKNGEVYINETLVKRERIDDFIDTSGGQPRPILRYRETLDSGKTYETLDYTAQGLMDDTGVYTVPEGNYFMMGDNRDNSHDSRYIEDIGFIPETNLIGRADVILFSFDVSKSQWWEIWNWPSAIRGGRFFVGL